jgi:uncharacterized protein (DUF2147 family)
MRSPNWIGLRQHQIVRHHMNRTILKLLNQWQRAYRKLKSKNASRVLLVRYPQVLGIDMRATLQRRLTQILASCCLLWIGSVSAQITPVGVWITSDDDGTVEIEIYSDGANLAGKILSFSNPEKRTNPRNCTVCTDDRKGKPMIGLEIIRAVPANGLGAVWVGGNVLDPDTGKVYRLRLELSDGGKRMMVRGYLGPFYRTDIWERKSSASQK